jgi:hypothetical protein
VSLIKPPCRLGSFNVLGHPCEEPEFALDATFHGSYLGPALPAALIPTVGKAATVPIGAPTLRPLSTCSTEASWPVLNRSSPR